MGLSYPAKLFPDTIWLYPKETEQGIKLKDAIHHGSSGEAPSMGGIELVAGFGGLGIVVFDALRLIKNNPVEFRLPRVQKRKFC